MSLTTFKGAIFDLDGVITRTAKLHAKAWEAMFNDFLEAYSERENKPFLPFDPIDDYHQYVDGKPRYEGVKSFLASRGIKLPAGAPEDAPDQETVMGLGNRKNELFQKLLKEEGPEVFPSSVNLIHSLKNAGIQVAVASSSRNCRLILEMAGLIDLFPVVVDGVVSEQLQLKGKPDPDIFTTAAAQLGLSPGECAVFEDAISGVQAGNNGNFGLVVGVARNVDGRMLLRFGADIVIADLGEIDLERIRDWFRTRIEHDGWFLSYDGFDPGDEKLREALTTIGNGYIGTRGCFSGERAGFNHYPGTYIAGIYNNTPSMVADREIFNNDLVNCPNWLLVEFRVDAGEFESPMAMEMLSYNHTLDIRRALLHRTIVCKDKLGRITRITSTRLASMAEPHLCALRYELTPLNYSGELTIRSALDGNVENTGVARYRQLNSAHLELVEAGPGEDGMFLHVQTSYSNYQVVMAAKNLLFENGRNHTTRRSIASDRAEVFEEMRFLCRENATYTLEKLVGVATSLDEGVGDPRQEAWDRLARARTFDGLLSGHEKAWKKLWEKADIHVDGDRFVQRVARLHVYHLLVTASPHNKRIDAGMPARGLHGESYRGHIFWDELYIMPFFDMHFPEISKALLLYRYRRLPAAEQYARENGYEGAMYPWQTADTGAEETQELHYNPESGHWGPDLSRRQRHVSIAVFYNVWRYLDATGDQRFLKAYGARLMIEIARFWASIAELDPADGRYHISGVMGPDEFHEKLPNSEEPGLTDNAYTNVMVVWLLEQTLHLIEKLPPAVLRRISRETGFDPAETERWQDMTRRMNVIFTKDCIVSQFKGYMDLDELNWDDYRSRYYSIARMDRILKAEGDSPDHYKVAKQADTLMMWYVLTPEEVARILNQLGYEVRDPYKLLADNYNYYEQRTSHGSTLSKVVHAVISAYVQAGSTVWDWFTEAMRSDIYDTQGGTTAEGVHTGVMAGTLDVILRYFAGLDFSGEVPVVRPQLPEHWKLLSFKVWYREIWYEFRITPGEVTVTASGTVGFPVEVQVNGHRLKLHPGAPRTASLRNAAATG